MDLSRKLDPLPRPCPICQTTYATTFNTCNKPACRTAFYRQQENAARNRRRAFVIEHAAELCTRCHVKKTAASMAYSQCGSCRKKARIEKRERDKRKAQKLYVQRVAMLRAERLLAVKQAEDALRIAALREKIERRFRGSPQATDVDTHEI